MKNSIYIFVILLGILTNAQTLGDFKPGKAGPKSLSKPTFDNKKMYIADFTIHYQVYNEESASKKGGSGIFGKVMGAAKASLAVGLDIPESVFQNITNEVYSNFVSDLKDKGFEVIAGNTAKNTKFFEGYNCSENIAMQVSNEVDGAIAVHPQNIGFCYKNNKSENYTKLSSELNDAAVARVDLLIEFVESRGSNKSGIGASVVAKTNLVLSDDNSIAHFVVGRNKIGGSPLAEYQGVLKKELDIDGVIKEEKISTYTTSDYDNWGTETALGTVYAAKNKSNSKVALVNADAEKYQRGVIIAIDQFLQYHLNEFSGKYYK